MNVSVRNFVVCMALLPMVFLSLGVDQLHAGFGITPPYVRNTSLTRNAIYEQQILLVRGDPSTDQIAEISIDAPELAGWVEIVGGNQIELPVGLQKVPMTVQVRVPSDAEYKDYSGAIRIRTVPAGDTLAKGSVNISLGARVDIDLTVIDKRIEDFRVRKISLNDLNEGSKVAWLFFPGRIRFDMLLENTGNVDISPSKVDFKIYDKTGAVQLEETTNIGSIDTIAPYDTDTVTAELPTRLPAGSYIARYRIYNGEDLKQEGDLSLNILPEGTTQAASFGFVGLSIAHKISLLLPIFAALIALLYFLFTRQKGRKK